MKDIIISIKPEYCKEIFSGNKTIELRKRIGKDFEPGSKIYIYTSQTEKAITGEAKISKIKRFAVKNVTNQIYNKACISPDDFHNYYSGHIYGYSIYLDSVVKYKNNISTQQLRNLGFTPPQSFMYAQRNILNYIEENKCI